MRRGELFKLVWSDVDFDAGVFRVRATTTKTETARTVGMTPRVTEALKALRAVAPPDDALSVFGIRDTVKTAFLAARSRCRSRGFSFSRLPSHGDNQNGRDGRARIGSDEDFGAHAIFDFRSLRQHERGSGAQECGHARRLSRTRFERAPQPSERSFRRRKLRYIV